MSKMTREEADALRKEIVEAKFDSEGRMIQKGRDNYIIALDRTCWKFGTKDINILFLVIVFGKISVPIYWYPLDHGGACVIAF